MDFFNPKTYYKKMDKKLSNLKTKLERKNLILEKLNAEIKILNYQINKISEVQTNAIHTNTRKN